MSAVSTTKKAVKENSSNGSNGELCTCTVTITAHHHCQRHHGASPHHTPPTQTLILPALSADVPPMPPAGKSHAYADKDEEDSEDEDEPPPAF